MAEDVLDVPAPKKRGRPPKTQTIMVSPEVFAVAGQVDEADRLLKSPVITTVERYRAEVAAHETLDEARKNYALDLLDRLLAELRG